MFILKDKVYTGGVETINVCFKAIVHFGNGVVAEKTFFPSSWSKKKVAEIIHNAALPENRLEELDEFQGKKQYRCLGIDNIFIDIVIDKQNVICSAYPSKKNFVGKT